MPISRDKQALLEAELDPGESLVWTGEPNPWRAAFPGTALFIFGLAWSGFVGAGFVAEINSSMGLMTEIGSVLFMIPFVLIGLGLMLSPVWFYFGAVRTVYGITTQRILIGKVGKTREIETYGRAAIDHIVRVECRDGTGNLTFTQEHTTDSDGRPEAKNISFEGIPNVHEVERLLRATLTNSQ